MRKFLYFFLLLILCFMCGCSNNIDITSSTDTDTVSVIMPDDETARTVNGYLIGGENSVSASNSNSQNTISEMYYANSSSKKFHKSTCYSASKIKSENLYKTSNRDTLISSGYSPCKTCDP